MTDPSTTLPSSLFSPTLRAGGSVIRRMDGDDAPWPGVLARLDDGGPALVVAAPVLGGAWPGWRLPAGDHVLTPRDVRRAPDGHDVVFPLCVERLTVLLGRRGRAMAAGEKVTIAVSVLRGTREVLDAGVDPGVVVSWWLTDDGRPVLALHSLHGDELGRVGAAILRDPVMQEGRLGAVCAQAAQAMADGLLDARTARRFEDELFDVAEPDALAMVGFGPRPAVGAGAVRSEPPAEPDGPAPGGAVTHLGRFADIGVTHAVAEAVDRLRSRLFRSPSRRSTVLMAGAAASGVLALGLLWPVADEPVGVAEVVSAPAGDADADLREEPNRGVTAGDPEDVAGELLDALRGCGGDARCRADLVWSETDFPAGAIDLPADTREQVLVDDFGGVAVLRVVDLEGKMGDQLVVIARKDDSWLLRDVHDVTQQP
ncbi:hypothetical protein RZO50_12620 [Microbacterium sp. SSW1-59]|uniref:hypothetical protein n=1 Tax=Microbacterium xanthum TaxID=3079794 RepID=UPI002AD2C539|nr:hypothetical protein [Microbacterium sp. SSW1-59]MDZ8202359.1 hypothetical protein [Microbacterium sp. SSW1-59]